MTQTLRLREYYYMGVRHKGWFFGALIVSVVIALLMAFTLPKIYRAETVLLVESETILNPLIRGLAISPSMRARMSTLREELLSWERLTLLIEKLVLDKKAITPIQRDRLIRNLRKKIDIKLRGADMITISYEGPDPKKAQLIVKTLADIIIGGNITSADLEANSAIRFIDDQLETYRVKLEESENALREFREVYMSSLPIATRLNEQLVALKMELNQLLVDNTEAHPRVIQVRNMIGQLEQQRDAFLAQAEVQGLEIKPEQYAKMVSSVPYQEQQLAKLQRNYAVNAEIYQRLLQKLETAKMSQTLEDSESGTKFRILEPARLPLEPVKPNKTLFFIGGLIVGVALGLIIIYLIELSDNSIRNLEEARNLLDLPIFGAIATIRPEELILGERLKAGSGV